MANIELFSETEWQELVTNDPGLPQTGAELDLLKRQLDGSEPFPPDLVESPFICATPQMARFHLGLRNPALPSEERDRLTAASDADAYTTITSAHFVVNYIPGRGTGKVSTGTAQAASNSLEQAYQTYLGVYGIPIVATNTKVQVYIKDGPNSTTPPAGPINLSSGSFSLYESNALVQNLMCFHEAFHLLQFQAGFTSDTYNNWFIEGSATWAELKYGSPSATPSISGQQKLLYYWQHQPMVLTPKSGVTKAYYVSLPFFVFLENYCSDEYSADDVMVDIIRTFKTNYPTPNADSVPSQIARCAAVYLTPGITFEELMVLFGGRMVQQLWNWTQYDDQLYPIIYDGEHNPPAAIAIPSSIDIPSGFEGDLVGQGNDFSSSGTQKAGTIVLQCAEYHLENADPSKTWVAQMSLRWLWNNYGVTNFFSVFAYAPGVVPPIAPFDVNLAPYKSTYSNPQNVTVYVVFSSTYDYPVEYELYANFKGT